MELKLSPGILMDFDHLVVKINGITYLITRIISITMWILSVFKKQKFLVSIENAR